MYLFTRNTQLFTVVLSFYFGISVATFLYLSKADYVCNAKTAAYCYPIIGVAASIILCLIYSILPNIGRAYVALLPTMLIGFVLNLQVTALAYTELLQPLTHLLNVTGLPLEVGQCFNKELLYSLDLIRQSLFRDKEMDDIHQGITEVTDGYREVEGKRDLFRESVMGVLEWLDSTFVSCDKIKSKPYEYCHGACVAAKADCYDLGFSFLCGVVDIGTGVCSLLQVDENFCSNFATFIVDTLEFFKDFVLSIVSTFIRMRISIQFSVHTTNEVGKEFLKTWDRIKESMADARERLDIAYIWAKNMVRFVGPSIVLLWPVYYIIRYRWGSLSFDNHFIPDQDARREIKITKKMDLPTELILFPLTEEERKNYKVVPSWMPTKKDLGLFFWQALFMVDLVFIFAILVADYLYTIFIHSSYVSVIKFFENYNGRIFDIQMDPNPKGLQRITEMLLLQLDKMQDAAQLGRLVKCVMDAPPITYGYGIFVTLLILRLLFIYTNTKCQYLPSLMCARFFPQRHYLRMKWMRCSILMTRERERIYGKETPHDLIGGLLNFASYLFGCTWLPWYIRCGKPETNENEEDEEGGDEEK